MVPKGFLRYQVISALNEKPMSGSELMEEISKKTDGEWKPSPGSIYPLLAWLQDNQYIKELPTENGLKRYELTQNGKELLQEERKVRENFREAAGFMVYPFYDRSLGKIPEAKSVELRMATRGLVNAVVEVSRNLKEDYSEKYLLEAIIILNESTTKLSELSTRLKGNIV